ncbi:MAG: DUF3298 domain-containing protein [Bacteroidota bacterium]
MRYLFAVLAISTIFFACNQDGRPDQLPYRKKAQKVDSLRLDSLTYVRASGPCEPACAKVNFAYFKASGGAPGISDSINNHMDRLLVDLLRFGSDTIRPSLEEATQTFFDDFNKEQEEVGRDIGWETELNSSIKFQNEKLLVLELVNYNYLGGVHPNTQTQLLNFDLQNAKLLGLSDLTERPEDLLPIVEAYFRKEARAKAGADIDIEDVIFKERLTLPQNVGIQKEGLYFFYNPYEVAAYAFGPTDFVIPYSELDSLVELRGLLEASH